MDPLDVEALGRDFAAGDADAMRAAYERFSPLVFTLALRGVQNRQDAEDIAQQVFVAAWRSRASFDPERASLGTWLVGITRNKIHDLYEQRSRSQRNTAAVAETVQQGTTSPDVETNVLRTAATLKTTRSVP